MAQKATVSKRMKRGGSYYSLKSKHKTKTTAKKVLREARKQGKAGFINEAHGYYAVYTKKDKRVKATAKKTTKKKSTAKKTTKRKSTKRKTKKK